MATKLNDYVFNNRCDFDIEKLLLKEIVRDEWFPVDRYGSTAGWLYKPQFRIIQIEDGECIVFDETQARELIAVTKSWDAAYEIGQRSI